MIRSRNPEALTTRPFHTEARLRGEAVAFLTPNRPLPSGQMGRLLPTCRLATRSGHIAVWSVGKGPKILLVHGWSSTHLDFQSFVAPLVKKGFNVLAVDLPAHGDSEGSTSSIPEMVEALETIGRRFGSLHGVLAHSLGCIATVVALQKDLTAPCIVLLAPLASYAYFFEAFVRHVGVERAALAAILRERDIDVDSIDLPQIVSSLKARALVVHSEDDRVVPYEHGAEVAASWKKATFRKLRGLGHKTMLSDPKVIELVVQHMVSGIHSCRPERAIGSKIKSLVALFEPQCTRSQPT